MKSRENSLVDTYRLRQEDYWKSIGMRIKEVFLSAEIKAVFEIFTLIMIVLGFFKFTFFMM